MKNLIWLSYENGTIDGYSGLDSWIDQVTGKKDESSISILNFSTIEEILPPLVAIFSPNLGSFLEEFLDEEEREDEEEITAFYKLSESSSEDIPYTFNPQQDSSMIDASVLEEVLLHLEDEDDEEEDSF